LKLFTNTFCTLSLTLTDKFNKRVFFFSREQHVCQQIGEKKNNKRNKNLKLKLKSSFTENNANRQSWRSESFTKDHNTTPSTYLP